MTMLQKHVHLFNCDKTCNLDVVESLLSESKIHNLEFRIVQHYFDLPKMSEMCDGIILEPQMDFAIFAVHANESRLSINEDNAGIGYAKIYRTLLQKTGYNVIIVIGGDNNYKDEDEENSAVISRWAWRKISSQFDIECLDGRKSFIFSWDKKHRPIHQEALRHYFDSSKKGLKFETQPKKKVPTPSDGSLLTEEQEEDESSAIQGSGVDQNTENEATAYVSSGVSELNYPEGTVLLETRLRYGNLSYDGEDVVKREESWEPPQEVVQSLERRYGSTPEAKIRLVVHKNEVVEDVGKIGSQGCRCAIL